GALWIGEDLGVIEMQGTRIGALAVAPRHNIGRQHLAYHRTHYQMHYVNRRDGTSTMAHTPDTSRTRVTAAILEQDGTILLVRRPVGRVFRGTWEFPGGKIEPEETPEGCLARELEEELGIVVEVGHLVATSVHHYDWGEME